MIYIYFLALAKKEEGARLFIIFIRLQRYSATAGGAQRRRRYCFNKQKVPSKIKKETPRNCTYNSSKEQVFENICLVTQQADGIHICFLVNPNDPFGIRSTARRERKRRKKNEDHYIKNAGGAQCLRRLPSGGRYIGRGERERPSGFFHHLQEQHIIIIHLCPPPPPPPKQQQREKRIKRAFQA